MSNQVQFAAMEAISLGPQNDGHLYRWKLGDSLAWIALQFCKESTDWKILYALNRALFDKRHNKLVEGDLIKIPSDWLPIVPHNRGFDRTKVEERNQDLQRESYLLKMFGQLKKDSSDD